MQVALLGLLVVLVLLAAGQAWRPSHRLQLALAVLELRLGQPRRLRCTGIVRRQCAHRRASVCSQTQTVCLGIAIRRLQLPQLLLLEGMAASKTACSGLGWASFLPVVLARPTAKGRTNRNLRDRHGTFFLVVGVLLTPSQQTAHRRFRNTSACDFAILSTHLISY